jgi:TetR/AcrR family transcriptional regulator, transcriptional repressor for nem operon
MARPLAFDPQEKLHQAMLLFWRKGYESTSVQDLVDGLGINRFSLYNTFGDKEALFEQVLDYYRKNIFGKLATQFEPASDGLPRLFAFLEAQRDGLLGQPGPWGCLLQNAGMVSGDIYSKRMQLLASEFSEVLHDHILAVLMAAQAKGQLAVDEDVAVLADFVATHVQGMIMMSRKQSATLLDNSILTLRRLLSGEISRPLTEQSVD